MVTNEADSEPDDDASLPDDVLRTAVHEAGHAVVAELLGYDVGDIYVDLDTGWAGHTSVPDGLPFEDAVTVALAGFAAVGVVLSPRDEQANRDIDDPKLNGSDAERISTALKDAKIPEDQRMEVVSRLDRKLRAQLARQHVGDMVEEIAVELRDKGGLPGYRAKATVERILADHKRRTGEDDKPFR